MLGANSVSVPVYNSQIDILKINKNDISTIKNSNDRESIGTLASRLFDKIADWFCGTNRAEAKKIMFDLVSPSTRDDEKIKLFSELKALAGAGFESMFEYSRDDNVEAYRILSNDGEDGAIFCLERQVVQCDGNKIQEVFKLDRSNEHLQHQMELDVVRASYSIGGKEAFVNKPLDKGLNDNEVRQARLKHFSEGLVKEGASKAQEKAIRDISNQSTVGLLMENATLNGDRLACPANDKIDLKYLIDKMDNGDFRLQLHCLLDIATLASSNIELYENAVENIKDFSTSYKSLEMRMDISINPSGGISVQKIDYLANKDNF